MVQFIIRVLKWLAAFVTAVFVFGLMLVILLSAIAFFIQPSEKKAQESSVVVLDLGMSISDSPTSDSLNQIIRNFVDGEIPQTIHLHEFLSTIDSIKRDNRIKGLLIVGRFNSVGFSNSMATLAEVREALESLKEYDKFIWGYLDGDSTRDIYIKSVADKLLVNPYSNLNFLGLRAERMYYGGLFDKVGVGVDVVHFGKFKSAGDHLNREAMSDEETLSLSVLLDDLWDNICLDISESRDLNVSDLKALADENFYVSPEKAKERGLVDELAYKDELIKSLIEKVGLDADGESFKQIGFSEYVRSSNEIEMPVTTSAWKDQVAVVYVEGVIVDGLIEPGFAGADEISRNIRALRKDSNVKALVLRVNSPGGSATASEKILREVELTSREKPVIISMGGYATSGGYWVSCMGDHIFAENSTITGSIGVVGMLPYADGLFDKLNVNIDGVQTSKHSNFFSLEKRLNEEELSLFTGFIETTYDEFKQRVAVGRGMTATAVEEVAQGRVWSGEDALSNGLVDAIGGLNDAIAQAASMASLDSYDVIERPSVETFEEWLRVLFTPKSVSSHIPSDSFYAKVLRQLEAEVESLQIFDDPNHVYALLPYRLTVY